MLSYFYRMNESAIKSYQQYLKSGEESLVQLKSKLAQVLILRLVFFGIFGFAFAMAIQSSSYWWLLSITGLALFLIAVKKNKSLKENQLFEKAKITILNDEINVLQGQWPNISVPNFKFDAQHPFALDLDVLGKHSLYHLLSRCHLNEAKRLLFSELLTQPGTEVELESKQAFTQHAAEETDWRVQMRACGELLEEDPKALEQLMKLEFDEYTESDYRYFQFFRWFAPAWAIGMITLNLLGILPGTFLVFSFMVPLAVLGPKLSKIQKTIGKLTDLGNILESYLRYFERTPAALQKSGPLSQLNDQVKDGYTSIQKLNRISDQFDARNNPLVGILLNALLGYDGHSVIALKKWQSIGLNPMRTSLQALAQLEYHLSIGTWAYHIEERGTYADFGSTPLKAEGLYHPFMLHENVVTNNAALKSIPEVHIVTGANMAGKSTFLRSIGVNVILASLGAPVCAKAFSFAGIRMYSSMRTTDSLQSGKSYFLSELERLALITKEVQSGEPILLLLDEILKGTNSHDKANGSWHFVKQLLDHQVVGFVATHDLSLCELEKESDSIQNEHFAAYIQGDDLSFDYTIKPGICDSMNATFLMKKLGIIP